MERGVRSLVKNVKARYRNAWYVVELSVALNAVRKLSESERKNVRSTGYYFFLSKNGNQILEHVNLSVGPEERLGILAPSGYGKTTLLKIISGYISPDAGRILVDGEPLPQKGYCPVQMIFQHPEQAVNPRLRMREVLKRRRWHLKRADRRTWDRRRLEKPFSAGTFRGELQRFCIARALGKGTKYLLCDEITTMLDFITQGQIWNFLIEETKRRGIGMVIVSHSQPLFRPCLYQTDQIERESVTQKRDFVTKERFFIRMTDI